MGRSKIDYPPLITEGQVRVTLETLQQTCSGNFPTSLTRQTIAGGLERLARRLSSAGVTGEIWVDGSFVTSKSDPEDADILIRVSAELYDSDREVKKLVDWASSEERKNDHSCDSFLWVEYEKGHPLHTMSEADRRYWSDWYGKAPSTGSPKGILVLELPL